MVKYTTKKKERGQQRISQERRQWCVILPNLYDDLELTPHEFRLLVHYVRVGECWESVRTTSVKCKMEKETVIRCRKSLAKQKLIDVSLSDYGTMNIVVCDVWAKNFARYGALKDNTGALRHSERGVRKSGNKEVPNKKYPDQEGPNNNPLVAVGSLPRVQIDLLKHLGILETNVSILERLPHVTESYTFAWLAFKRENDLQIVRDPNRRPLGGGFFFSQMRDGKLPPGSDSAVFAAKWRREQMMRREEE